MFDKLNYNSYFALLSRFKQTHTNLCFSDFAHERNDQKYFIVRHDIDFSPVAALNMAALEAQAGIRSTYFLLFASPHYNILAEDHRDFPRRLTDLGHEVGLHYDVRAYARSGEASLVDSLVAEAEFLGKLSGVEVKSIAMHNPSIYGEDPFRDTQLFINAYDDRFTKDIVYLSDSCGAWRDSAISELGERIPPRLQLLIHPFFWGEDELDRWQRLERLRHAQVQEVLRTAETTRAGWTNHAGVLEHDRRQEALHKQ